MRLFRCQHCGQVLYFENVECERCHHQLGFLADRQQLSALVPEGGNWRALADPSGLWRYCDNARHQACNWLVPAEGQETLCRSCRHNRVIPDLSLAASLPPWRQIEIAKRRFFYSLLRFGQDPPNKVDDPEKGLAFNILADPPVEGGPKVMTGHDNGLITLALAEADDAERERRRTEMGEPYRTLLGHVRHESGHYFWDRLVRDGGRLEECRSLFGDDQQDYGAALQRYYATGAPPDWQQHFVSAYASAHPWEDFAETWAHYLHIVDTLEMADAFGLTIDPKVDRRDELTAEIDFDAYTTDGVEKLVAAWLPLTFAMNSLSRCMGARDLYPFILSPEVVQKLGFIHSLLHGAPPVLRASGKSPG